MKYLKEALDLVVKGDYNINQRTKELLHRVHRKMTALHTRFLYVQEYTIIHWCLEYKTTEFLTFQDQSS